VQGAPLERGPLTRAMNDDPLWRPSGERIAQAEITRFLAWLGTTRNLQFATYESLWTWSVRQPEDFWAAVWVYFEIPARRSYDRVKRGWAMPDVRWFEGAELNYVDQVFRHRTLAGPAIVFDSEAGGRGSLSWPELERQVAALAQTLRDLGVRAEDRVVGYLPNIPETVVAFLATASIGAIWSVSAPDMGPTSVLDRFKQISPKVLIACDGYRFGGRAHDRRSTLELIVAELPTIQTVVWVDHLFKSEALESNFAGRLRRAWRAAVSGTVPLQVAAVPAAHPLWILYSSGTTGVPKAIVHGHAGMLLTSLMAGRIHADLNAGDRVFWTSSTSWMVWNAHVSCLLAGATIFLFDGSPCGTGEKSDWGHLWGIAARERLTHFGAGAAFYHTCMKASAVPRERADLSTLKVATSTGSPLSIDGYRWLKDSVKSDLWINSTSGGTDICGAFLGGLPSLPVYAGEMQCRILGAAVDSYDNEGRSQMGEVGELVCTAPMPSMPLYFWGDEDKRRYRETYFGTFHGADGKPVWRHGDWVKLLPRPDAVGAIIYGRSDATINRHGVRMGTADLYRAVERFDEIVDCLAADLEYLGREPYLALFVVLRPSVELTSELDARIRHAIRTSMSPRHVPDDILAVPDIPKTLNGKKLELPIKRILLGYPVDKAVSRDLLANPESLDWFIQFARTRTSS